MPELRQNFFTKEWVIIATERAKRPEELVVHRPHRTLSLLRRELPLLPRQRRPDPARTAAPAERRRLLEGSRCPEQVRRIGS